MQECAKENKKGLEEKTKVCKIFMVKMIDFQNL